MTATPLAARFIEDPPTYRVLDLFSGIGGFSLGLERTGGFKTIAFCEIDKFCQRVLRKHWPEVPIYDDIRELTAARLTADGIVPDVLCGGFPCQDISTAGKGAGIDGERSGLWLEYARLIGEILPQFVIVENVSALLGRGLGRVLGDLAALGYDAEWYCIPASSVGAPHIRDRVWIIAYAQHSYADEFRPYRAPQHDGGTESQDQQSGISGQICEVLADAIGPRLERRPILAEHLAEQLTTAQRGCEVLHADSTRPLSAAHPGVHSFEEGARPRYGKPQRPNWWLSEPDVGRVAHGIPSRVDRLRSLGNAVVPQIPELIGRAILASGAVGRMSNCR